MPQGSSSVCRVTSFWPRCCPTYACRLQGHEAFGFCGLRRLLDRSTVLKDRVLHGGARLLKACDRTTYHLFTDASYEASQPAGLGGILYSDRGLLLRWFSECANADVLEAINLEGKQGLIYELEACAAVQGVLQLCGSLSDCDLICYCDNEAALSALIRCASESPVVAAQLAKLSMFGRKRHQHLV